MGFGLKSLLKQGELKEEEKAKYVAAFEKFDKDKNGALDVKEMGKLLKNCHFDFDEETVADIMRMSDLDGTHTLNLGEFLYFMANISRAKHSFRKHDKNNNGSLSRSELQTLLNEAGFKFSPAQTEVFYPMVDKDNSNSVEMSEFIKLAVFLRFTAIQFLLADTDQSGGLSVDEVNKHLPALGLIVDDKAVKTICEKMDTNKNGVLDADEFALLCGMIKLE